MTRFPIIWKLEKKGQLRDKAHVCAERVHVCMTALSLLTDALQVNRHGTSAPVWIGWPSSTCSGLGIGIDPEYFKQKFRL